MTVEEIFQPGVGPVIGAIISGFFGINVVFFRWLLSSFSSLKSEIKTQTDKSDKWMDNHEFKDQSRHEENLYRFEKISVALARMGSTNGTKD